MLFPFSYSAGAVGIAGTRRQWGWGMPVAGNRSLRTGHVLSACPAPIERMGRRLTEPVAPPQRPLPNGLARFGRVAYCDYVYTYLATPELT
jgi:hypothetical protein